MKNILIIILFLAAALPLAAQSKKYGLVFNVLVDSKSDN